MNLDDAQKKSVTAWIAEGLKLSDIQGRLVSEFGLRLTYMEVRFLVDDLKLMPKDPEPPAKPVELPKPGADKSAPPGSDAESAEAEEDLLEPSAAPPSAGGTGKVSVSVDKLAVPGAIVSGSVTFSDGQSAKWYLDETGRLGIAAKQKGYRPAPQDLQVFQRELQTTLAKMGF